MSSLLEFSNSLADLVAEAGTAVVAINARQRVAPSGIHWRKGIVVTSDESLRRHDNIAIVGADGRSIPVTLIGRDPTTDLAAYSLEDADRIPTANVGDTASLRVGHLVMAIARSSEGDARSALGTASAIGGQWQSMSGGTIDRYIRPDLSLYRGFAGGVLVDMSGRAIGMNTTGQRGTALTIPAETIDRVINQLLSKGRISRGYLGVGMQPVRLSQNLVAALNLAAPTGVILVNVEPNSPAEAGGLLLGDVVISLDEIAIADPNDVRIILNRSDRLGQQLKVTAIRGGTLVELMVTVGER
jgi:S1-C subfamily serine protease